MTLVGVVASHTGGVTDIPQTSCHHEVGTLHNDLDSLGTQQVNDTGHHGPHWRYVVPTCNDLHLIPPPSCELGGHH